MGRRRSKMPESRMDRFDFERLSTQLAHQKQGQVNEGGDGGVQGGTNGDTEQHS